MIISHTYKFLFIEVPLTGSWTIHNELCEYYGGESILHKHATYAEFRRQATKDERGFFVFAAVRNPLDKIVSRYYKIKMDQKGVFSSNDFLEQLVVDYSDVEKYKYLKSHDTSFEDYFVKFCNRPYSDMIDLSSAYLNYVIRYENIQEGFSHFLMERGIEQIRALPWINKTPGKTQEYLSLYTPKIVDQAKRTCGPFMKKWGYFFPKSWGATQFPMINNLEYRLLNVLRYFYVVHLRYNNALYAVVLRKLRARLFS